MRLLIAALCLTAACTTGSSSTFPTAPEGPRSVTLITHDSFDVSKDVLSEFERTSGIDVEVVPAGDAGQVVNRAILTAGDPEADVLFGVDDNLLHDALDAEVFVPYASPRLDVVPDELELDPEHRVTPIDRGDVCVNIDDAAYSSATSQLRQPTRRTRREPSARQPRRREPGHVDAGARVPARDDRDVRRPRFRGLLGGAARSTA